MNSLLILTVALLFVPLRSLWPAQTPVFHAESARKALVHFQMINLSGNAREAHLRGGVVNLPVGKTMMLQAHPGECVKIMSSTDSRVSREITLTASDEGRTFPIGGVN